MPSSIIVDFRNGAKSLRRVFGLAFINLALSLIDVRNIMYIVQFPGFKVDFRFLLPKVIPTLWDFILMGPVNGVNVNLSSLPMTVVYVVIAAILQYLYVYYMVKRLINPNISIDGGMLSGIILYNIILLVIALIIAFIYVATISPALTTLMIILYLFIYYFIYSTPYVIVLRGVGLGKAFSIAVRAATRGDYLLFTILYGLLTLALSPLISAMVYGAKIAGILVASVIEAPIGLWLSASTLMMVNRLMARS